MESWREGEGGVSGEKREETKELGHGLGGGIDSW